MKRQPAPLTRSPVIKKKRRWLWIPLAPICWRQSFVLAAVIVASVVGSAWSAERGVKVDGHLPAEYVAREYGQSWAVVIGIDQYTFAPPLRYAADDASAVAALLKERDFHVTLLLNQHATRRQIYRELFDQLGERVKEQDRVLVFFAGHGETRQLQGGREMGFLLPVDGNPSALAESAISMVAISELADALPAKHVLFVVDSCYGGIAGHRFRAIPKATEPYLREITLERGRQLITAGGAKQEALEGPKWGHSVFTYYLLEAIAKGRADMNNDGIIPASELYQYLEHRVFAAASFEGQLQRTQMWSMGAEKGEFVFFAAPRNSLAGGSINAPALSLDSGPLPNEPHRGNDPDSYGLEARLHPLMPSSRLSPSHTLEATYKLQTVGKAGEVRINDPRPSPFFAPFISVPSFEVIEKHLSFRKDGRFDETTYVAMEYSEPGSGFSAPMKRTPRQLQSKVAGTYQLKGTAGILTYSSGHKIRFSLPEFDEAFWPPSTIIVNETQWGLIE